MYTPEVNIGDISCLKRNVSVENIQVDEHCS